MEMLLPRPQQSVLLLCLLVTGCVIYRPAAKDPADLAIIEETSFPVAASPALRGRFAPVIPGQVSFGVNGVDGTVRLFLPGRGPLQIDAGTRKLSIACSVSFENLGGEWSSVNYSGAVHMICTLEPEIEYVLKGRMAGPDVSYGVEAWLEEKASGTIAHPVVFIQMHQSVEESETE